MDCIGCVAVNVDGVRTANENRPPTHASRIQTNKINYHASIYSTFIMHGNVPIGLTHNSHHNADSLGCLRIVQANSIFCLIVQANYSPRICNVLCIYLHISLEMRFSCGQQKTSLYCMLAITFFGWLQCNVSVEIISQSHNVRIAQSASRRRIPHADSDVMKMKSRRKTANKRFARMLELRIEIQPHLVAHAFLM